MLRALQPLAHDLTLINPSSVGGNPPGASALVNHKLEGSSVERSMPFLRAMECSKWLGTHQDNDRIDVRGVEHERP